MCKLDIKDIDANRIFTFPSLLSNQILKADTFIVSCPCGERLLLLKGSNDSQVQLIISASKMSLICKKCGKVNEL